MSSWPPQPDVYCKLNKDLKPRTLQKWQGSVYMFCTTKNSCTNLKSLGGKNNCPPKSPDHSQAPAVGEKNISTYHSASGKLHLNFIEKKWRLIPQKQAFRASLWFCKTSVLPSSWNAPSLTILNDLNTAPSSNIEWESGGMDPGITTMGFKEQNNSCNNNNCMILWRWRNRSLGRSRKHK